jgi:epoxyqueuosine reductase
MTADEIVGRLEERGWRAAVLPAGHIADLHREIESRKVAIGPAVRAVVDRNLDFAVQGEVPEPRSLIVVVVPHACARVTLVVDGTARDVPVPTTYCHHDAIHAEVEYALMAGLGSAGLTAARIALPEKLLAVCGGLARYGCNNIAYVDGWGSFVELVACVSDLEPDDDPWTGPRRLSRCGSCSACARACPTGAIDGERFLLHGDLCLTLHNESEEPFPEWIDPSWHHCLVGCLRCQQACPENVALRDRVAETATFDERESELLMTGATHGLLAGQPAVRDKLDAAGLLEYDDLFLGVVMPRNLKAVAQALRLARAPGS